MTSDFDVIHDSWLRANDPIELVRRKFERGQINLDEAERMLREIEKKEKFE